MNQKWNRKGLLLGMAGFLMSRVALYGMYPIAIAFFVAAYTKNTYRGVLFLTVISGLLSTMDEMNAIKYGLVILVLGIVGFLMERMGKRFGNLQWGVLGAVVTLLLTASNVVFRENKMEYMVLAVLEAVFIITLANLFQGGLDYWLYGKKGQPLSNEQMISVIVMLAFALRGTPGHLSGLSVMESVSYCVILFMGYKYGAGAGAITGVGVGLSQIAEYGTSYIGLYCIIGIAGGMFRELGRWGSGVAFFLTGVVMHYVNGSFHLSAEQMGALASGSVLFLFMPKSFLYIVGKREDVDFENVLVRQSYQVMAKNKLKEFSEAFQNLSENFYKTSNIQDKLGKKEMLGMFDKLSQRLCSNCSNCTQCWEKHYYDTYHEAIAMVHSAEQYGVIRNEDVSPDFAARCIHFEDFIMETSKNVEYAKWNLNWSNKLAESRALIAEQLNEVSNIIREFSLDLSEMREVPLKKEEELLSVLHAGRVKVKKLTIIEKRGKKLEVHLTAKTKKNDCVTAREVAAMIGEVLGKPWKPEETIKNVLPKEYEDLVFVEDVNYRTLTGMARIAKNGERISGDAFSFLHLSNGEMIMVLSDGMGAGRHAYQESESVVELLENLLEAGFREESAIRLINSVLVLHSERQTFSTVDISVINLYTGICEIIKNGASATFIKRDGWIETIQAETLPVGMVSEASPEGVVKKLYDGDLVVMVTDGVMDCFPDEDKEFYMENLLVNITSNNPQEIANAIMNHALEKCGKRVADDMSVMVAGIWEKSGLNKGGI